MSDRKVTISVETTSDNKGLEDTTAAVKNLAAEEKKSGEASKESGDKKKKSGEDTQKLGQAAGRAAELVGSLSGAAGQNGPAVAQMGAGLRVLKSAIEGTTGPMGLLTVAIGAGLSIYTAYHNKVEDTKKKLAEFVAQIEANKRAQESAGVDLLAGQYNVLRTAIDEASAAQDRLNQAQASADNADKAADLAELSLREKEAMANSDADPALKRKNPEAAAKQEDLNKARITNQFAQERRSIEEKYAIAAAEREAQSKASALADAERKQSITENMDIPRAKEEMQKFEDQLRKVNEALADAYGAGAPKKYGVEMGSDGEEIGAWIVDKEAQAKLVAALRNQKVETDKDGKPTGKGLDRDYQKSAEALSLAIDRLAREKIETQARRIEAEAAVKQYDTTRLINPEINAAEGALEQKSFRAQQMQANRELLRGRLDEARGLGSMVAMSRQINANQFDASTYNGQNPNTRSDAKKIDRELDKKASAAKSAKDEFEAYAAKIEEMPIEELARAISQVNRNIDQRMQSLKREVEDMKARSARP